MVHEIFLFNVEADSAAFGVLPRVQQFQIEVCSNRDFLFGVEFHIVFWERFFPHVLEVFFFWKRFMELEEFTDFSLLLNPEWDSDCFSASQCAEDTFMMTIMTNHLI